MRAAFILALAVLSSFTPAQAAFRVGWPKELNFGVVPVESAREAEARYRPLAAHLQKVLGIPVKLAVGADYAAVVVAMQFRKLDMAYLSPSAYLEAARRARAEAFACEIIPGVGRGTHSVIVSRAQSGIRTLAHAKGQTFAFVDPQSTTGYLLPRIYFAHQAVEPDQYFKQVVFSGSHEASIEGVVQGRYAVAATSDQEVEVAIADHEIRGWSDLNVLWKSPILPTSPLAYRRDLPDSLKTAIREAVLSFKDEGALAAMRLKGFALVEDKDYNVVRDLEELHRAGKR
ncbi:MAG: phosphonate ABC transporter substrate-binding protein [Armatimonadota bacterium]